LVFLYIIIYYNIDWYYWHYYFCT